MRKNVTTFCPSFHFILRMVSVRVSYAHWLLLGFYIGITPGSGQRTIRDAGDKNWVAVHKASAFSTHCTLSLSLFFTFLIQEYSHILKYILHCILIRKIYFRKKTDKGHGELPKLTLKGLSFGQDLKPCITLCSYIPFKNIPAHSLLQTLCYFKH